MILEEGDTLPGGVEIAWLELGTWFLSSTDVVATSHTRAVAGIDRSLRTLGLAHIAMTFSSSPRPWAQSRAITTARSCSGRD